MRGSPQVIRAAIPVLVAIIAICVEAKVPSKRVAAWTPERQRLPRDHVARALGQSGALCGARAQGAEWSRVEWSGGEQSGVEQSGSEWGGSECARPVRERSGARGLRGWRCRLSRRPASTSAAPSTNRWQPTAPRARALRGEVACLFVISLGVMCAATRGSWRACVGLVGSVGGVEWGGWGWREGVEWEGGGWGRVGGWTPGLARNSAAGPLVSAHVRCSPVSRPVRPARRARHAAPPLAWE